MAYAQNPGVTFGRRPEFDDALGRCAGQPSCRLAGASLETVNDMSHVQAHSDPDLDRIKELILFIAKRCQDDPYFGGVKLNKILFWADVQSFRDRNQSVTQMRYRRLTHGPVPTALIPALKQLEDEGACHEEERPLGSVMQKRVIADREPELSRVDEHDLAYIEAAIRDLWNHTATSVSAWSHEFLAYELTPEGDYIPMKRMLLRKIRELTEAEQEFGRRVFEEAGYTE